MTTASMTAVPAARRIVVVGQGAAGLTAAVAAAEESGALGMRVEVTVIDKADQAAAGGNTRWSPSYMRMDAPDRLPDSFVEDLQESCGGQGDSSYFRALARNATATVRWLQGFGIHFCTPVYYLSSGPRRIQPVGGGVALLSGLSLAARYSGVTVRYSCRAQRILMGDDGAVSGVVVLNGDGRSSTIPAEAVVLASGGFQGDGAMMRSHFGENAERMRMIAPGTGLNTGDGIRMALEHGARVSGDWNGMHAEPVDARGGGPAPVVLVYPYGIVVDRDGERFFDEGAGLVHETWERFARKIHFEAPGSVVYAILDSGLFAIADFQRAIRSELMPFMADTLLELAAAIDVDARGLADTVARYNAAATGDPARFDPTRLDGLCAHAGLNPPKSNWARPLSAPPFLAYPLAGAIAYTFGGLATSDLAEVLGKDGRLPGMYAAGEVTGHFYRTAPNAVSVLRALVFGRIAGMEAARYAHGLARERAL
jgi:tricarballylate dehydrogenase